jgi:hypothetical protein
VKSTFSKKFGKKNTKKLLVKGSSIMGTTYFYPLKATSKQAFYLLPFGALVKQERSFLKTKSVNPPM